jgi:hypothetical protein
MGAKEPKPVVVRRHDGYTADLVKTATEFMGHVFNLTEPVANPYVKPPKPEFSGVADMTGNNLWATAASRWVQNLEGHKAYEFAAKEIKEAVPPTAKEAFGHGIRVKRNAKGSLTIKPDGADNGEE